MNGAILGFETVNRIFDLSFEISDFVFFVPFGPSNLYLCRY